VCGDIITSIRHIGYTKLLAIFFSFALQLFFILRFFKDGSKVMMSDEDRNNPFFASGGL